MDEALKDKLIAWVKNNYDPTECGYTPDKSFGDAWGSLFRWISLWIFNGST